MDSARPPLGSRVEFCLSPRVPRAVSGRGEARGARPHRSGLVKHLLDRVWGWCGARASWRQPCVSGGPT